MRAQSLLLLTALVALLSASSVQAKTEFGPFYLTVTDTYLRVEWSVVEDKAEVSYYDYSLTNTDANTNDVLSASKNVSTFYPEGDDMKFENLIANTNYRFDITGYLSNGKTITAQETFKTRASYVCDEETIAAFFSSEVYGPVPYPSYTFCGRTWTTYYSTPADELSETHREIVVFNQELGLAVVAFRGTIRTLEDWTVNFELDQEPCENFINGKDCDGLVHDGFGDEYKRSRSDIRSYLTDLVDVGFSRVIVTGHSQGAALATLAAIDLLSYVSEESSTDFELRPITLGSPKVGDEDFVDDWDERFGVDNTDGQTAFSGIRFVGTDSDGGITDPITSIPFDVPVFLDYEHVKKKVSVTFLDDDVCKLDSSLFIPCHSILAYLDSIAADSSVHFAPWTGVAPSPNTTSLRTAVVAPTVKTTRAAINVDASPSSNSPSPSSNSPSSNNSPSPSSKTPFAISDPLSISPNSPSPNSPSSNSPSSNKISASNIFDSPSSNGSSDASSLIASSSFALLFALLALLF